MDSLGVLLRSTQVEQATSRKTPIRELLRRLGRTSKGPPLPSKQATKETEVEPVDREPQTHESLVEQKPSQLETIRISTARLDSILLQAEEMVSAKLAASQRITDLRGIGAAFGTWKKEWTKIQAVVRTIQQSLERNGQHNGSKRNQQTTRLIEFLEWNNTFVKSMEGQLSLLTRTAEQDRRLLAGMVDDLLNDMKRVLMLPFSSVLEIFPKLVRDLSRNQAKQVELLIQGGEIEVDRRILEEMKDPLIHLVRNCIDHGIEKPEERKRQKKSPQGTVRIAISQKNGSRVEILISDDGAGIDLVRVKSAALKLGTVSQAEAERLGDKETLSLVFQPELSTSPIITDISGRGLGLAIVQEKVEKLGGGVSLATQPDRGTTLRIDLPLTLARFRGILVLVEDHLFVLPTSLIQCVARVKAEEIKTVGNRETIRLHGQALSLVRLKDVLDLSRTSGSNHSKEAVQLLVLGSAENRIAFLVDEIIGEQEVLVKGLGKQLSRVRNIAGATILGAGRVVPILNVPDLLKSAVKIVAAPSRVATEIDQGQTARKSVLIVEDSITARTLLKNILEAAGYSVKAAVDGVDALTALKSESVDLVVSDVEMPRMDGFELTA
ncbi:MAG: hybrid sensor histidine kinase/response regulator, partial [Acidobacteria bacterium]